MHYTLSEITSFHHLPSISVDDSPYLCDLQNAMMHNFFDFLKDPKECVHKPSFGLFILFPFYVNHTSFYQCSFAKKCYICRPYTTLSFSFLFCFLALSFLIEFFSRRTRFWHVCRNDLFVARFVNGILVILISVTFCWFLAAYGYVNFAHGFSHHLFYCTYLVRGDSRSHSILMGLAITIFCSFVVI